MKVAELAVASPIAASSFMGGCIDFCGEPWEGSFFWNEPGLYEQMPPDGEYNGYDVYSTGASAEGAGTRHALRDEGKQSIGLTVEDNDNVTWWFMGEPRSAPELRSKLNRTFEDLGIESPRPANEGAEPETGHVPC